MFAPFSPIISCEINPVAHIFFDLFSGLHECNSERDRIEQDAARRLSGFILGVHRIGARSCGFCDQ